MGFLSDLVADLRRDLEMHPLDDSALMARVVSSPPPRDFVGVLRAAQIPAVIAEIKRASPSAGPIAQTDAGRQAELYAAAGASAVSVLTERTHFGGALADLRAARLSVSVPVLRKDFLVHPSQLIESRAEGADAVLLIAACLTEAELRSSMSIAADLGLGTLVETHTQADLDKAIAVDAPVIGVNARDLESLDVDVDRALEQLRRIPDDRVAVMESGISDPAHVRTAVRAGAAAVLVGEALMRSPDPGATLRALRDAGSDKEEAV
ncbi:MAG: indole-3-glycerol phosphate synthase TrpC [Actinomycetota bacterium]